MTRSRGVARHFPAASLALAASLSLAVACASPPPPPVDVPPPVVEPAPEVPAAPQAGFDADSVAAARAKALGLRDRAFDLGLPEILPGDWSAAETAWKGGLDRQAASDPATRDDFDRAAGLYASVLEKGLPLASSRARADAERLAAAAAARGSATRLEGPESTARARMAAAEASEKASAWESALGRWKGVAGDWSTALVLLDALDRKTEILERDLAAWDPSNWKLAEAGFEAALAAFDPDPSAARQAAEEAALRYANALRAGREYLSARRRDGSNAAMEKARAIKAEVAAGPAFEAAKALHEAAAAALAGGDLDAAATLFGQAADGFEAARAEAAAEMAEARAELDSLEALLDAAGKD